MSGSQATDSASQEETPVVREKSPKSKKRLNLDLTPEAHELLQKLADESGKNMAEVLRTGLALYGIAYEEKQKGNDLAIVKDEEVKKQIIIP